MKKVAWIITCLALVFSCQKKEDQDNDLKTPPDLLEETLLLGTYEIQSREISDVISTPVAMCCEFLTLESDENRNDFNGNFAFNRPSSEITGSFTLDTLQKTLTFLFDDQSLPSEYSLDEEYLSLEYFDGVDTIYESWKREE